MPQLRTPLNGISTLSALIAATPLEPELADFAKTIQTLSSDLIGLVNDLLDASRLDAHRMSLEHAPFDLRRDVVESVTEQLAEVAAQQGLELTYVTSAALDPPLLVGDAFRLRQILNNLICPSRSLLCCADHQRTRSSSHARAASTG